MKAHSRKKAVFLFLLILAMLVCSFEEPLTVNSAQAVPWPKESTVDEQGRTVKTVEDEDGTVQIWQFLGIFGDENTALVEAGVRKGSGKVKAGERTYIYKTEKKSQDGESVTDGKSTVKTRKKNKGWLKKLKWGAKPRRITQMRNKVPGHNIIYLQDNRGSGR